MSANDWGVLLDLDDTLVWTAALVSLRTRRAWQEVYAAFHLTTLPPGTGAFLRAAQQLGSVGVVTMSPRPYAEKLLHYHGLVSIPVLVAYQDVQRRKPHPEPLLKAAARLHLPPTRCVYVGDMPDDMEAAHQAGATPIGLRWPDVPPEGRSAPLSTQYPCENWDEVSAAMTAIRAAASRKA